ncbi:hypothetical protein BN7_779 [Wickerhamomyces ciferrii]|uniref:Protein kinase domain-containing protein n=1 Tax=Wickerhamomyces ciferrii (strain ATCC 14091 / BCRC 22168 / CBS 111 / JCM 3599 / NBRC 0793 / NRRL Y-1031 F-60-10) TaxID=1206466 RepID=K0KGD5_WICCF|nr:uncharacterized protein BN7_779 [Wickerhamomyces ciferrii]CCH41242.1 hypothetical protein BN7_779 [Wickerhamomyces ciferrii]
MSTNDRLKDNTSPSKPHSMFSIRRAFGGESASRNQNLPKTNTSVSPLKSTPSIETKSRYSISPVSPEFESITELPSPIVGDLQMLSAKKSYGSLSIRPSANQLNSINNARIISEYGSTSSKDSTSSTTSNLDARLAELKDPQKRSVSTPMEVQPKEMEREKMLETSVDPSDVFYKGYDHDKEPHVWKHIRTLGKGTFSDVVLAQELHHTKPELQFVAVKIVELPSQRDTRARVESSLKRELELLKLANHPSIIKLLALHITSSKYYMYTPYCEGGDLFELASKHRKILSPYIIKKIFAEIARSIAYLHNKNIVHRDIKLENILVNYKVDKLLQVVDQNVSLITVTDFGLSRTIDPENPLLTTRCGSEDYVPPELLIGLPYDGRQTDSWALGVLLYSIMEGRLPFDPPPNKSIRARSRVAHRIARIEWSWNQFSDENKGSTWKEEDWEGAKYIVENLLVRREKRLSAAQVCEISWVKDIPELQNNEY